MDVRWEGDERGEGVADAAPFAGSAGELVEMMGRPRWVAEDPDVHLLPHIERACAQLPLSIEQATTAQDGAFELRLRWTGEDGGVGQVRAAVYTVVGSFSEATTYVRQRRSETEGLLFEVVTGFLNDAAFGPHGHTVHIHIT